MEQISNDAVKGIKMLNGYILLKDAIKKETRSKTGLILPNDKYQRVSIVVAVGNDSRFKVGDVIVKPIGKTTPLKLGENEYECIKEDLVFAKL